MTWRRRWISWWLRKADSLSGFEHAMMSAALSGAVAGVLVGWLGCYFFHHA